MRRLAFAFFFLLIPLTLAAQNETALLEHSLRQHGVLTTPDGLAAFLEQGWQAARPPRSLPADPPDKFTLVIDAWNLLARHYEST
ncbi:hypothetical protein HQ520_04725, partial [bacterium]|nr:hypothetical protein [bacterium]